MKPGEGGYRRIPNEHGGSAAVHPSDTSHYLENGIPFADGRFARVEYVEHEAYVDVIHFYFQRDSLCA